MMLRRSALLALLVLLGATSHALAADGPAAGAVRTPPPDACHGVALERFERNLPADTRRYAIGAHLAQPFAALWDQARRPVRPGARPPTMAAMPDAVTVYAQLNQSLLVAYRAGDCVLTVVKLPRDQLLRLLREELGEPV